MILPPADPVVAARTFRSHLDTYWLNSGRDSKGWTCTQIDELHTVVTIPARHADDGVDPYYVRLGAEYYDAYPPTVLIVAPEEGWPRARAGTPWWPIVTSLNWMSWSLPDKVCGAVQLVKAALQRTAFTDAV